jgi:hypothetical protein
MTLTDQRRTPRSTFEGHGVFEARHLGKARESRLSFKTFEALLGPWSRLGFMPATLPKRSLPVNTRRGRPT